MGRDSCGISQCRVIGTPAMLSAGSTLPSGEIQGAETASHHELREGQIPARELAVLEVVGCRSEPKRNEPSTGPVARKALSAYKLVATA